MESNLPVETKDFKTRMMDRVRESIGELLTDDELKTMIDRSMHTIFFAEKETKNTWGQTQKTEPPLMHEIVKKLVDPRVEACVQEYIKEHEVDVKRLIEEAIDRGLARSVMRAFDKTFLGSLRDFSMSVAAKLDELQQP